MRCCTGERLGDGEDLTGSRFSLSLDVLERGRTPCTGLDAGDVIGLWPVRVGTAEGKDRAPFTVASSSSLSDDWGLEGGSLPVDVGMLANQDSILALWAAWVLDFEKEVTSSIPWLDWLPSRLGPKPDAMDDERGSCQVSKTG